MFIDSCNITNNGTITLKTKHIFPIFESENGISNFPKYIILQLSPVYVKDLSLKTYYITTNLNGKSSSRISMALSIVLTINELELTSKNFSKPYVFLISLIKYPNNPIKKRSTPNNNNATPKIRD